MGWMRTYTGQKFFVDEMADTTFSIQDIAHALANQCRFGGHTKTFYSVAQHSVMVADIVQAMTLGSRPDLELWALMHDATEAYMIDVPTPLKVTLPGYEDREHKLMALIAVAFGLKPHGEDTLLPSEVKLADRIALVTEARQLVNSGTRGWAEPYRRVRSYPVDITPMTPAQAERAFMKRWASLQGKGTHV